MTLHKDYGADPTEDDPLIFGKRICDPKDSPRNFGPGKKPKDPADKKKKKVSSSPLFNGTKEDGD
ncbi:MAG: hypothetical protein WC805_02415 [Patescibacteria group bacterium]|jgi:hypothetical protein